MFYLENFYLFLQRNYIFPTFNLIPHIVKLIKKKFCLVFIQRKNEGIFMAL